MSLFPHFLFLLPDGFRIDPLSLTISLALAGLVSVVLYALKPPVRKRTILAFTPWIIAGAALHVLYVLDSLHRIVMPFFSVPTVYITIFAIAGGSWAFLVAISPAQDRDHRIDTRQGMIGIIVAAIPVSLVFYTGFQMGTPNLLVVVVILLISLVVWAISWFAFSLVFTSIVANTGIVGALVVFSHVLDGVSTAVGVDVFMVHERSPIPRAIMDFAGTLPIADIVGVGWLFVAVKLAIAFIIVALFDDYVNERPDEGLLLLGLIAAVGLGPGIHNILLFMVGI